MNKIKITILLFFTVLMVLPSCNGKKGETPVQSAAKKTAPLVRVQPAVKGSIISYIDITGTVETNINTDIKSPVNGIIEQLNYRENQRTEKDKVVAVINPDDRLSLISANQLAIEELEKKILSATQNSPEYDSLAKDLEKAKSNLKFAREMYQPVPVICPMNGIVTSRWVEVGGQVVARDKIITISDMNSLVIKAEVNERYFEAIAPGRKFPVVLNAYPTDSLTGIVTLVYPSVSSESRAVKFDLKLQGFNKKLLPGMMAQLKIPVYRNDMAVIVHDDAVLSSPDGKRFVFVVGSDTIARQRIVNPGVTVNRQTEIREGLKMGELVVTAGQETLKDNVKVSLPVPQKNSK
jgi:RND family efflux transporter MFP subunit